MANDTENYDRYDIEIKMKCEECGHIQDVKGFIFMNRAYFGSAYDFCDLCGGLPIEIEPEDKEFISGGEGI